MVLRMKKERITVSLDSAVAARVRQCAATSRGGASGYLERLVQEDALRDGVDAMARWYASRSTFVEHAEAERVAIAEELGETG